MRNNKFINNIFDFIEVFINFDDKLYKKAIKNTINFIKEQKSFLN